MGREGSRKAAAGGRVAFLDYGCVKVMPSTLLAGTKRYVTAAMDGRWDDFEKACVDVLGFDPTDEATFRLFIDYTKLLLEPMTKHGTMVIVRLAHSSSMMLPSRGRSIVRGTIASVSPISI